MRRFHRFGTLLVALLLALTSASAALAQSPVGSPVSSPAASPVGSPTAATHGVQIADMDLSVDPAQDFYQYANGGWLARTEIPGDSSSFGVFDALSELTDRQQFAQLDKLLQDNTLQDGSDQWKAVEFYKQGIDLEARNAAGIGPLQPQLDVIASIISLEDMHQKMATSDFAGIPDFFNVGPGADAADSSMTTAWLAGPALGLPDVTYYTEDSESNIAAREAYQAAAAQLFMLTGMSEADATAAAQAAYDFEASLAADMITPIEAQDVANYYHPTTLDDMQTLYPALDWQQYLTTAGATVDGSSTLVDTEVRLMENLAALLGATDLQTIKDYLSLQVMMNGSPYLSQDVRDIRFGFQQVLYGVAEQRTVEEYTLTAVNTLLPDAMGQLYVSDYFSPQAKADIEALVANLIAAFRVRIQNNTWMSDETKAKALEKLDGMKVKVGYPDKWETYENYTVGDSYYATVNDSLIAQAQHEMAKYGQPVDRSEWWMSPQTVNAGYDPSNNDITFPAAILQPPFYDPDADPASNYGAIGYVIGHEITHGFDLQGSQFDKDGNYSNWWTDEDLANFQKLNDEVVAEYNKIEVLPGVFVDGQLTVTENVADMGGLQTAWDALQLALQQNGDPGEIDGLSQAQRFFIAAAQTWREKIRPEYLQTLVQSDPHGPAIARATVPSENMDAFYEAFPEIQPGSPEYIAPEDRIVIW
ncbi:MAG TPA: M13 family metallopeptidase [Thermomicrobiales bacterium]|nr:M13 family metallopeptidase [Thermomicrobiales bacterium]